ncbi:unnamed protein product, partial [Symbiodinium sp. KB8]
AHGPEGADAEALRRTAGPLEYELYIDGKFFDRRLPKEEVGSPHEVRFADLPSGKKLLEMFLPTSRPLRLSRLETDGSEVLPCSQPRRTWLCYGSSISHGGPSAGRASC